MKKSDINDITKWAETKTNDELESEYYDTVYNSLGSQTEVMYELGYDISDIKEREQYEKYLSQRCDALEDLCQKRSIKLWQ